MYTVRLPGQWCSLSKNRVLVLLVPALTEKAFGSLNPKTKTLLRPADPLGSMVLLS